MTAVLMAEAARTLLEGDHNLEHGGVYTPASLGQGYVDRLDGAGFHLEKGSMTV